MIYVLQYLQDRGLFLLLLLAMAFGLYWVYAKL
jgi:hypothetical protein